MLESTPSETVQINMYAPRLLYHDNDDDDDDGISQLRIRRASVDANAVAGVQQCAPIDFSRCRRRGEPARFNEIQQVF